MTIKLAGVVILAGGESSRMGSPKALLSLPNGETLLDFHIRHAKRLNVPVMVADNGKRLCHDTTVKIIDDYLPNQHQPSKSLMIICQINKMAKGQGRYQPWQVP